MLQQKRGEGGSAENLSSFPKMLDEYYRYPSWDESGVPSREKLQELELSQAIGESA